MQMPGLHRDTLSMTQTISYATREPIPTFPLWSTVISTLFMDVFRRDRGGQRKRRQGGECIMYKEK